MKIYDLTHPLNVGSSVFPGTPKMDYKLSHTIEKDCYRLGIACVNSHVGTHTDAPAHFLKDGAFLGDVSLEKYVGNAVIIDCTHKSAPFSEIDVEDLIKETEAIKRTKRVLIKTGWDKKSDQDAYYTDYPVITVALSKWLVEMGVVMLGVEPPSLNPADYIEVHAILLGADIAVVEGLTNLDKLENKEIFFVGAPIPLKEADGFPIRAIAIEF